MLPPELAGRYEARAQLGRGGFGRVVSARDRELGRMVAIKVLEVGLDDEDARRRFAREARLTAALRHPHVVGVYDHGFGAGGAAWILYELIEGEDLLAWAARVRPDAATLARVGAEVAEALAAVHDAGVLHRDLKPANVLVRPDGAAVLCDFGIARSARDETQVTAAGVILGTPAYMAPELFRGLPASSASDVFGWAAALLEVRHGRGPYDAEGVGAVIEVAISEAPLPRGFAPRDELDQVLVAALARDPAARTADARALARALRAPRGGSAPARPAPLADAAPTLRLAATAPRATGETTRVPGDAATTTSAASDAAPTARVGAAPLPPTEARRRWWPLAAALPLVALVALHPAPFDPAIWRLLWLAGLEDLSYAQVKLAERYLNGDGVARDGAAARTWIDRALANPVPNAYARQVASALARAELAGAGWVSGDAAGIIREAIRGHDASTAPEVARADWGEFGRALEALAATAPDRARDLLDEEWARLDVRAPSTRAAALAARWLRPGSPLEDRVRGRVALWAAGRDEHFLGTSQGEPRQTFGWARLALELDGSRPWRWYGRPAGEGDPLARLLLGWALLDPQAYPHLDRRAVWFRETGAALLASVRTIPCPVNPCDLAQEAALPRPHPTLPYPDLGRPEPLALALGPQPIPPRLAGLPDPLVSTIQHHMALEAAGDLRVESSQHSLGSAYLKHWWDYPDLAPGTRALVLDLAGFWLGAAALGGHKLALTRLAEVAGLRGEEEKRQAWTLEAARRGSPLGMLRLGQRRLKEEPHSAEVGALFAAAAGKTEGWGWLELGRAYWLGQAGLPRHAVWTAVCLERAAREGREVDAVPILRELFAGGDGFRRDREHAATLTAGGAAP